VRGLITFAVFIVLWWAVTAFLPVPLYMLPTPQSVALVLATQSSFLAQNTGVTLAEILLGLLFGTILGAFASLMMAVFPKLQRWLMPMLVISQAIPVFALAPLMVLWFGFGMVSKVLVTMLVIFFPVTAALADGLRQTKPGWLDLAATMNATRLGVLWRVRVPAALPAFASGLRVATALAPIGAIIGEWVGASSGLGYVMINANARIETDVMFAALFVLCVIAVVLFAVVDRLLRRLLYWVPDSQRESSP
jgi:putative hydroxymethylpyrimidine transport system permease protein